MKSRHPMIITIIMFTGLLHLSPSQTIDDIKLQVSSGNMSVEQALEQAKNLENNQGKTADTAKGMTVKQSQAYSPVFLKDYISQSEKGLAMLSINPLDSLEEEFIDSFAVSEKLDYFGYDVFKRIPENFRQIQVGPVDPNYIIGPGDEIILSMWGATEQRYSLTVERDGTIYLEKAGQIIVNGYTVEELKKRLENVLSKFYSTIRPIKGQATTFIDVSLGKLRPILVYVIGEVNTPGAYAQDAYSTVFGALLISGGPSYSGSLRDIQVIRNNKVVAHFDVYRFLSTGKKDGDIRLRNDDIIFVPHRINTIYLKGEVTNPAVYELIQDESLRELVSYAGGLNTRADINRVQIERTVPFAERSRIDQNNRIVIDESLGSDENNIFTINRVSLNDQDIVTIFPVFSKLKKYVTISGAVYQPGRYSYKPEITVGDLIESAQGILPEAYQKQAQIIRTYPNFNTELITIDITDNSGLELPLMDWDSLRIFSVWDIKYKNSVRINGEVRLPGRYPLHDSTSLKDIIMQAGGFTKIAYNHSIEVFRADPSKASLDKLAMVFNIEIKGDILNSKLDDNNFQLFDNDEIMVRSIPYFKYQQNVIITGEVKFPGTYTLIRKDETLTELVERAGGLTPLAFLDGIEFTRGNQKLVADFQKVIGGSGSAAIILEADDNIYIPKHPQTVAVIGMVNSPGLQKYIRGQSVKQYIENAGGLHRDADKGEIYVYQANGAAKRNRKLNSPKVTEGSKIIVGRKEEREPLDITEFLKEVASITASVVTIFILVTRVK